ncbi:MAG TPA: alpha/beta hydrolase [Sphingobacteriaceae bacterium]|nr:alpha/beta hydrolase [Sphingobacteriaceae bacterium]
MSKKPVLLSLFCVLSFTGFAQHKDNLSQVFIYKKVDTTSLKMEVLYPKTIEKDKKYPCIVFFFGGGWLSGNVNQFREQSNYLTKRGMICFLVDYRVQSKHHTTPFESLKDAKSAIRYIRKNADRFHINADVIVASGGSAGGHLAVATALIDGYNDLTDDLSISTKPNALVLFNPVIDTGPAGYGFDRMGNEYKNFSPLHNIKKNAPPTIIFLGTKDNLIPVETARYYKTVMEKVKSRCDLILYEGQDHGFFNKKEFSDKTIIEADKFLTSLGFLKKEEK